VLPSLSLFSEWIVVARLLSQTGSVPQPNAPTDDLGATCLGGHATLPTISSHKQVDRS
jgi:hypothetical protein